MLFITMLTGSGWTILVERGQLIARQIMLVAPFFVLSVQLMTSSEHSDRSVCPRCSSSDTTAFAHRWERVNQRVLAAAESLVNALLALSPCVIKRERLLIVRDRVLPVTFREGDRLFSSVISAPIVVRSCKLDCSFHVIVTFEFRTTAILPPDCGNILSFEIVVT